MGDSSTNMLDFGFAFGDKDFSDRVLNIINDSDCCNGVILKTLHVSSPILAVKSPFFFKLFKNDMKEAQQRDVTLRIKLTEELSSLMDLLNFIHTDKLSATTSSELLGVLMLADKFEVISCMKYCVKALLELPMSQESVLSYLELPPSVSTSEVVKPLIDASQKYLLSRCKYFDGPFTYLDKALKLPLSAIEVVLGSNDLQVRSEDFLFNFIMKWARTHYPEPEGRREILTNHLTRLVCFPNMSCSMLKRALTYPDLDHEQVSKLVTKALFAKIEVPYGHASKDLATTSDNTFSRRVYTYRPIKVVRLESPWPRSIVYLNLTKDECANLFPSKGSLFSESFLLDGHTFYLKAECHEEPPHHFVLYLLRLKGSTTYTIDYEFSVVHKSSKDFQSKFKINNCIFEAEDDGWGAPNLFGMTWTEFMSDDCEYFINGILHLKAELTLVNS